MLVLLLQMETLKSKWPEVHPLHQQRTTIYASLSTMYLACIYCVPIWPEKTFKTVHIPTYLLPVFDLFFSCLLFGWVIWWKKQQQQEKIDVNLLSMIFLDNEYISFLLLYGCLTLKFRIKPLIWCTFSQHAHIMSGSGNGI